MMMTSVALVSARPRHRLESWLLALLVILLISLTCSIALGPVYVTPLQAWKIAVHEIGLAAGGNWAPGDWSSAQFQIVWRVRTPRTLLAALAGAGLALVGVAMQAMVRNPLADPYLLGVSSGASVGAVSVIAFGALAFAGELALPLGAFGGALAACTAVYFLAYANGRLQASRLILGGVAIAYCLGGITSLPVAVAIQVAVVLGALGGYLLVARQASRA